jgi:hypothetical protein
VLRSRVASADEEQLTLAALIAALQLDAGVATADGHLLALVRLNDRWKLAAPRRAGSGRIEPIVPAALPPTLETVSAPKRQRSNVLPTSLHSLNVASKNEQPVNAQLRNAASTWLDALKSQSRNVHSENTAPRFADSVNSTPMKPTWAWLWPERSVRVKSRAGLPIFAVLAVAPFASSVSNPTASRVTASSPAAAAIQVRRETGADMAPP